MIAAPFDRLGNQLARVCLFWAAIDSLCIAHLLLTRSSSGFYLHMLSGLLLVLLLALQRYITLQHNTAAQRDAVTRRGRGVFYSVLVLLFWWLVSHYAPLWHDVTGRVALLGLLVWLLPLSIAAGFLFRPGQALLANGLLAWGTLIVLAWTVQTPSMRALQAGDVSAAALIAGFHVVTASLSSVSLTMLVAYYLQAYRQLAATAGRDYLTGLVNRGKLYELLRYEMARATRQRRPLSLMFYDIDDFGLINKQHGHPIGDRVLRTFTQQVQGQLRGVDHLGRWGGEEFMAIIPDTTLEDAYYLAERVRATLSATPIPPVGIITASFGVVTWQADDTIESLLSRLDIAVRDAKWQGKNRVVIMHAPDNPDDA